ncbi:MAG TPA: hypothetical protein VNT81_21470 [Vicinamibacterales bacterium]|nr:hypothetical protein [Vicinamibacterales bacterium]
MPTLQDITLAHSQRLSEIYRTRDIRIAEVQSLRDIQLRDLPAAAKVYQKYDDDLSVAREKQLATEAKAEAARSAALIVAVDRRGERFEDAQMARRSADTNAVQGKHRAEDLANRKYESAVADLRDVPSRDRDKAAQLAERDRRDGLDGARRAHDEALAAAQQKYRSSIDEALVRERQESRDAERSYLEAVRLGEAAYRGAKTFADQALAQSLEKLPDAKEILRSWRAALATIASDTREAEREAFSRFRRELDGLKT